MLRKIEVAVSYPYQEETYGKITPTQEAERVKTIVLETLRPYISTAGTFVERSKRDKHRPSEGVCCCTHPGVVSCGKWTKVLPTPFGDLCVNCVDSYIHDLKHVWHDFKMHHELEKKQKS